MDMLSETLIIVCWELYEQGIPKSHIARKLGKHRETIHIWIKGIQQSGLLNFLDKYQQAEKGERKKRQVNPILKRWVWLIVGLAVVAVIGVVSWLVLRRRTV